ncbi:MAG: ABC transporter permease [Opitutaceae bacterium]
MSTAAPAAPAVPLPRPIVARSRPRRSTRRSWALNRYHLITALLPLAILALWAIATYYAWVPPILLPSPLSLWPAFQELLLLGGLWGDFWESLRIVVQGFTFGAIIGISLGAICGYSKLFERFFGPTFDAIRQIPPIAVLSLLVLWFGIGDAAKVILIAKAVFFPVFLNTLQGIRGVQKEYVEVGHVLQLTRWQFARKIIIPGALPSILTGIRFGAGLSWSLVVFAETLSGHKGLGYLIWRAQELLFINQLFIAVLFITALGLTQDRLIRLLERRLLRWKQGYSG